MNGEMLDELRATTRAALAVEGRDIVGELGLAGLLVDEELGGLGLGEGEMTLVAAELGRALAPSAFLPTAVMAVTLLGNATSNAAADLLRAVVDGKHRCAVLIGAAGESADSGIVASAVSDGTWKLTGNGEGLSIPGGADLVLVTAGTEGGAAIFAVSLEHVGINSADLLDPGRGLAEFAFNDSPARQIVAVDETRRAYEIAYRRALLAVAAEQLGVARKCLETAVDYAKNRTQFGSFIGSFQAIKHRCADVLLDIEFAEAVLADAVGRGTRDDAELAFILGTRAAVSAAESNIQIHGGIGFTWEHSAHWYLRRARANSTMLGSPALHRQAIERSIGLSRVKVS